MALIYVIKELSSEDVFIATQTKSWDDDIESIVEIVMSLFNILKLGDFREGLECLEIKIEAFDLVQVHLVSFYSSISEIRNKILTWIR